VCDGHGIAHPRRLGLAAHLGLVLDLPSVGCAKTPFVGDWEEPGEARGSRSPLVLDGETVGTVLRTRDRVKPVFVSPGHRIDREGAVELVERCLTGVRLPETTRRAHQLVNRVRKAESAPGD
jgi:deoxyribonuclease V